MKKDATYEKRLLCIKRLALLDIRKVFKATVSPKSITFLRSFFINTSTGSFLGDCYIEKRLVTGATSKGLCLSDKEVYPFSKVDIKHICKVADIIKSKEYI